MTHQDDPRARALDALDDARSHLDLGGGQVSHERAQAFATVALAEAVLASREVLIDIRDRLQEMD